MRLMRSSLTVATVTTLLLLSGCKSDSGGDSNSNSEPIEQNVPEQPLKPTTPIQPLIPLDPATPIQPLIPLDPATPIQPLIPLDPATPIKKVPDFSLSDSDNSRKVATTGTLFTFMLSNAGDAPTECKIESALPAGLSAEVVEDTCAIKGIPLEPSVPADYVITGVNEAGASPALAVSLQVLSPVPDPTTPQIPLEPATPIIKVPDFSLSDSDNSRKVATTGTLFTFMLSNAGDAPTECKIESALPAGLSAEVVEDTCAINGIPSEPSALADYVITGVNEAGASPAVAVSLQVLSPEPEPITPITQPQIPLTPATPIVKAPDFSFSHSDDSRKVATTGTLFTFMLPNAGDAPTACKIEPLLPVGLNAVVAKETCVIKGTPSESAALADYVVTGVNKAGSSSGEKISLQIISPVLAPAFVDNNVRFAFEQDAILYSKQGLLANNGGAIDSCSITPSLSHGLDIAAVNGTCKIIGTPVLPSKCGQNRECWSDTFTMTGTNDSGNQLTVATVRIGIEGVKSYAGSGPDPELFDAVTAITENESAIDSEGKRKLLKLEHTDTALKFTSGSFPNKMSKIVTSDKQVFTEKNQIEEWFNIDINPVTGDIQIRQVKTLDFEQDPSFYELTLQLGSTTKKVLVRLYDVQGIAPRLPDFEKPYTHFGEAIKVSTLTELRSAMKGQFVSEGIGFDDIKTTNTSGIAIQLDRDIDAKGSQWESIPFKGILNGQKHVIKNLNTTTGFVVKPVGESGTGGLKTYIQNIGFENVHMQSTFFNVSSLILDHVFVSGYSDIEGVKYVGPIVTGYQSVINSVYFNLFRDFGQTVTRDNTKAGGIFSSVGSLTHFGAGYNNGAITARKTGKESRISGLVGGSFGALNSSHLFYSAMKFDVSGSNIQVGGLISNSQAQKQGLPDETPGDNNYPWRFIKDRGTAAGVASDTVRHIGNGSRDKDNDGITDDNAEGIDLSAAGMTEAEFRQTDQFNGNWSNAFDIRDGQYPVLTDMPYSHTSGTSWLHASDPGVVYQRSTYDQYLTPESQEPVEPVEPQPQPEPKPELKPDAKPETKPEPRPQTEPTFVNNNVSVTFTKGAFISSLQGVLENNGGVVEKCTITPALGWGLKVAVVNETCSIVGIPTLPSGCYQGQECARGTFIITASNDYGSQQADIQISVEGINDYTGDGPDPSQSDMVASIMENEPAIGSDGRGRLLTYEDGGSVIQFSSSGFPNKILTMATSDQQILTKQVDIEEWFRIDIKPETGDIQIRQIKTLDFEKDPAFYELTLQLGKITKKVLVRLYDVQGSAPAAPHLDKPYTDFGEAIKVSTLAELRSAMEGQFESEEIGFDSFKTQYTSGIVIQLDRDIDAEGSDWEPIPFIGVLDGQRHVIKNLRFVPNLTNNGHDYSGFTSRDDSGSRKTYIQNLGFENVQMQSSFFRSRNLILDHVFVSGYANLEGVKYVGPIVAGYTTVVDSVYFNLFRDFGHTPTKDTAKVGGVFSSASSSTLFGAGYSNGAIIAESTGINNRFGGLIGSSTGSLRYPPIFYNAMKFDIGGSSARVGGLISYDEVRESELPDETPGARNYPWRFIKDRGTAVNVASETIRNVGNGDSDLNNDGVSDDGNTIIDLSAAGITETEFRQTDQFSGNWNKAFDITGGQYPVLKNMPYSHALGASWLQDKDPGVAYQRAHYDNYLTPEQ